MNFWDKFFGRKESQARVAIAMNQIGLPQTTPANYEAFSKEGYQKNATIFRSISLIAKSCGNIPLLLFRKNGGQVTEVEAHPLLDLLERPNPLMGRSQFIESVMGFFGIAGNSYINAVAPSPGGAPTELWPVNAGKMSVVPGSNGYPMAYVFKADGKEVVYRVDFVSMKSEILHLKTFNPLNLWYGMSPMEAVLLQVDQQTAANRWNLSLLQNHASPSGVLTIGVSELNPHGKITDEQFVRLKNQMSERYGGFENSGKPMLLEGGLAWTQMAFNPKDMEYGTMKNMSTREIANVYGVPPLMLNIAGDNTYANYKEARQAFYEDTIIPLMGFLVTELNNWLTPIYGDGFFLDFDKDSIDALAEKRAAKFTSIKDASFLTQNEKREAAGYDKAPGWDVFVIGADILPGEVPEDFFNEPEPKEPEPIPNFGKDPNEEEDPNEDDEMAIVEDDEEKRVEIKFFNVINRRERRQSLLRQTRLKRQLEAVFEEDLKEDFLTLNSRIEKTAKEVDPSVLEFALLQVLEKTLPIFEDTVKKNLRRSMRIFGDAVFGSAEKHLPDSLETKASRKSRLKFSQFVEDFIGRRSAENITEISNTTRKQVITGTREILANYEKDPNIDIPAALQKRFSALSDVRAAAIARTETQFATQNGSEEAVRSLEIPNMKKEWVATIDDQSRFDSAVSDHVAMDGARVGLDEKFIVPPDAEMNGPGDPSAPPEQVINCRCVLVYNSGN